MLNKNCDTIFIFFIYLSRKLIISGENGQSRVSKLLAVIVAGLHPGLDESGENLHNLH